MSLVFLDYYCTEYRRRLSCTSLELDSYIAMITDNDQCFEMPRLRSHMSNRMTTMSLIHPKIRKILKEECVFFPKKDTWCFKERFFHTITRTLV
jgi:hypothetical protein